MNKIFKVIWSQATQTWLVVSELAKGNSKSSSRQKITENTEAISFFRLSLLTTMLVSISGVSGISFAAVKIESKGSSISVASAVSNTIIANSGIFLGDNNTIGATSGGADGSIVLGDNNAIRGNGVIAFGSNIETRNYANGSIVPTKNTILIGNNAASQGIETINIGSNARTSSSGDIAIGRNSFSTGGGSTALGDGARVGGSNQDKPYSGTGDAKVSYFPVTKNALALGVNSYVQGGADSAVAVGHGATVGESALRSIAIGQGANVAKQQSIAVGAGNNVSNEYSGAFGNNNNITTSGTFVLGNNVAPTQANSIILGVNSSDREATTETTVTINNTIIGGFAGAGSSAKGVVSVGAEGKERQIINVAAGKISADSTDAVTGSQLYAVLSRQNYFHVNPFTTSSDKGNSTNLDVIDGIGGATGGWAVTAGVEAQASGKSAVAMGKGSQADSLANIAIGENAQALTADKNVGAQAGKKDESNGINKAIAIGSGAQATNAKTIAIGDQANASGRNASAIGSAAIVSGAESTGVGVAASVTGDFATGIGQRVRAVGAQSTAIGTWALTSGDRSTAIGRSSTAVGNRAAALGSEASAVADFSVSAGAYSRATDENAIAVGRGANANAAQATSIGRSATAIGASSIAIGENALAGSNDLKTAYNDAYSKEEQKIYDEGVAKLLASNPIATDTQKRAAGNNEVANRQLEVITAAKAAAKTKADEILATAGTKTGENAVAIGNGAIAEYKDNVVLGAGSRETSATVANPGVLASVNNAEVNGITYDGFAATSPTSVVSIGVTGRERRLINVAAGKISSGSTDAINGSQLYSAITNGNWKLHANGNAVGDINWGDKVNYTSDDKSVTITPTAEVNGVSKLDFKVNVDTTTITKGDNGQLKANTTTLADANSDGKVDDVANDNKGNLVTAQTVAEAINNSGFKLTATKNSEGEVAGTKEQLIKSGETVTIEAGKNMKLTQANDKITVATKDDVTFNTVTATTVTSGGTILNNNGLTVGGVTVTNAPITVNGAAVNNINQAITDTATQAFSPLTFAGDSGNNVARKLGTTLNVKGGAAANAALSSGNIAVVANGRDTLDIKLAKDLKEIDSIAINQGPTINGNGINMAGDKITNLQAGTADGDAVNVKQLKDSQTKVVKGTNIESVTATTDQTTGAITYTVNSKGTTASTANADYVKVTPTDKGGNVTDYAIDLGDKAKTSLEKADTALQSFTTSVNGQAVETINQNNKDIGFVSGNVTTARKTDSNDITFDVNFDEKTLKQEGDKLSVNTTNLTNTDGKIDTPTNGDALVNASTVADAINKAGFKLKTSVTTEGEKDNTSTGDELINAGDVIDVEAGKNIKVKQDQNGKITVSTKDDVSFKTVSASDSVTIGGTTITPTANGLNFSTGTTASTNTVLTGVTSGLTQPTGNNLIDLNSNNVVGNTAATVGDLRNMGWMVSADKTTENLTAAYTDQVKNANEVKFVGTGLATVSGKTVGDVRTITVDVNAQNAVNDAQLPVVYTKADGTKVEKAADGKFYPAEQVNKDGTTVAGATEVPASEVIASLNNGNNSSIAPTSLANVKGNLAPSHNKGDVEIGTDGKPTANTVATANALMTVPTADEVRKMYNNAATVGDVLNAGWNLQENNNAKDFVKAYDTVNFVNGSGTTAKVTMNDNGTVADVTYDVNTTSISQDTATGKAKADTQAGKTGDLFATATSVADAINKVGLKFSGDVKDATAAENTFKRENQDEAKIIGGVNDTAKLTDNNIGVVSNGSDTLTVKLGKDITVDSVKAKDNVTVGESDSATKLTSTTDGLKVEGKDGAAQKITNVAKGTEDTDAVNVSQLNDKLAASKWKLQTSQDTGTATDVGEINADDVVVIDGTGAIKVTNTKEDGNTSKVHIAVETAKISTNPGTGKAGTGDNGSTNAPTDTALATAADVINVANNISWSIHNGTDDAVNNVKAGNQVHFVDSDQLTASVTKDGDDKTKVTFTAKTIELKDADTDGTVDVPTGEADKKKLVTAENVANAINASGWKAKSGGNKADGDQEHSELINPGDEVEFNAGSNLKVKRVGTVFTFETAQDVKFNSVQFGNDGPKITNNGSNLTVGDKDGNPTQITNLASGLRQPDGTAPAGKDLANAIKNASGSTLNNAVNVGDLKAAVDAATTKVEGERGINVKFETNTDGSTTYKVTAKTDDKTITVNKDGNLEAVTSELSNNATTGVVNAPADDKSLVTAKSVVDAINNSGFVVTASGNTAGTVKDQLIKTGEKVTLDAGKNLTVTQRDGKFSFATKDDVSFTSVTSNSITVPIDAASPANNPITINKDGINAGNKTISNVAGNLADASTEPAQLDANSLTNLDARKNNAATVGDVLNAGWNLQGNGSAVDTVTHNDTVDFVNGKGTVVTVEKKDGKNIIKVDSPIEFVNTNTNDTSTPSNTAKLTGANPVQLTNVASGLRQANGTAPTGKDLASAIKNASGDALNNAVNVGDLKAAVNAATTKVEGTQGVTVTPTTNDDGSTTYTVAAKTDGTTIKLDNAGNITANTTDLKDADKDGKVDAPSTEDGKKLITAGDVANAINNSGWNLAAGGTDGKELVNPSDIVTFKAGSENLTVKRDGADITYDLAKDIKVDSVTSNTITVPTDAANPANNPITINKDGINAGNKTISNVAGNLADASTATSQPDANSLANLDAKKNNAATVGDVLNAGWNLQGNGTAVDTVTHNDTVDFVNGKGTVVTVEKKDGKNIIKVDSPIEFVNTNTNDTSTPSNTAKLTGDNPVQLTNVASGLRKPDGTAPTGKDLADAIKNAAGDTLNNAVNVGDLKAATGAAKTEVKGTGLATVAAPTIGDNGQAIYIVDVAKADAPTVARGSVTVKAGDENKVMVAGDVAKAITDSEKTSSVKAGSSSVTVAAVAEDANGNTEYTVDVATDKTIARDNDGKLTVNTGSSLKVDGTTGKIDVNTDGTTITTDATGAVKANTTALTNDTKGKVNTPVAPNALATAGDIANAINNSGFTLKTSANGGSKVSGVDEVINPGETIDMAAGKNLTVKQDADGKVTYATSENVTFTTMNSTTVVVGNPADPNNSTTLTSGNGGLNVGGDKITGVADGDITPTSQDAVNGSQLYALAGNKTSGSITIDGNTYDNVIVAPVTKRDGSVDNEVLMKTYNVNGQTNYVTNSAADAIYKMNEQGIKFFHTNDGTARVEAQADNEVDSSASGVYSTAIGYQTVANGDGAVSIGNTLNADNPARNTHQRTQASGKNSIAIGTGSQANAENTISIGTGNIVNGQNSGAIGDPTVVTGDSAYSIGNNNTIATNNTYALGSNITATSANSVFLGDKSASFEQAGSTKASTGAHVAQGTTESAYTYRAENDANVAGKNAVGVVSVGNANESRQIQGVAAGVVSATSTDAINGSQLYYTNKAIRDIKGDVNKLGNKVNRNQREARAGIAGAAAIAGLPEIHLAGKSMLATAASTYKGENAIAVGYSRLSDNSKVKLKITGSADTRGDFIGTVGVGYAW